MKCEGLPCGKPCPHKASGSNVHFRYAELDLCSPCEKEHRKAVLMVNEGKDNRKENNVNNKSTSQKNSMKQKDINANASRGSTENHSSDDSVRTNSSSKLVTNSN